MLAITAHDSSLGPFIASGRPYRVVGSPEVVHSVYMVYPRETAGTVLEQALQGLRELAGQHGAGRPMTFV